MLPLVFLPGTPTLLAGRGPAFAKRRALLEDAGLTALTIVEGAPDGSLLDGQRLVFGAGLSEAEGEALAAAARARGIPVNIEDVLPLCDVHVPALVRRGDLLLTVSTAGQAPGVSAALRSWLAEAFGPEWAGHLAEAAALRTRLRAEACPPGEVMRAVQAHLRDRGLLEPARCRPAREPIFDG
ncbi:bifunctional precorrin-2 dehydrogenase/sirohydrochlorin ferrochelatase [Roseomonas sp. CCTCC AB2023176]|uniref:precorrin-2 dehydrogenase/sirohydrochlorin ferrochelatase family protein n=1 Tax=Roseomonas sp. CCTCC AB2023176 TaxID=3342640 RepID=UPI0035E2402B